MNLRWSEDQRCSNEDVDKVFLMAKSFITFSLTPYYKNAFHSLLFISVYSILQMELYLQGLVQNHSQNLALCCLEIVTNKNRRVSRKKSNSQKIFSTRKINFQLAKLTF